MSNSQCSWPERRVAFHISFWDVPCPRLCAAVQWAGRAGEWAWGALAQLLHCMNNNNIVSIGSKSPPTFCAVYSDRDAEHHDGWLHTQGPGSLPSSCCPHLPLGCIEGEG